MVNEKWSIISLHSTVISAEPVVYPEIEEFIISLVKQPDKVVGFSLRGGKKTEGLEEFILGI